MKFDKHRIKVYMEVIYPGGMKDQLEIKNYEQIDSTINSVEKGEYSPESISLVVDFPQKDTVLSHRLANWKFTNDKRDHIIDLSLFSRQALIIRDAIREWVSKEMHPMAVSVEFDNLNREQIGKLEKDLLNIEFSPHLETPLCLPMEKTDDTVKFSFIMGNTAYPKLVIDEIGKVLEKSNTLQAGTQYRVTMFQIDSWSTPEDYMQFSAEISCCRRSSIAANEHGNEGCSPKW